jgi:hypothetical protein
LARLRHRIRRVAVERRGRAHARSPRRIIFVVADAYPEETTPATVARIGLAVGRKRLRTEDPRERLDENLGRHAALEAAIRGHAELDLDDLAFEPASDASAAAVLTHEGGRSSGTTQEARSP